jgi:threonine dehydratase
VTDLLQPRATTLIESPALSERLGADVTLASETFQRTGSFKFRAAANVVRNIPHPAVITGSSGNFGQAMAYACQLAGKRCTVVMPHNSVQVKVDAVRGYGATVDLVDTTKVSRAARVAELAAADPAAYVASPYDDPFVIEGNATLAHELAAVRPAFDSVVVQVGGGGLSAGIVQGFADVGARTAIVGAEPLMANDAAESLRQGRIVASDQEPQTIADGARTRSLGVRNWEILRTGLQGIVEVSEDDIRLAIQLLFMMANLKAEPTAGLTVGALLAAPDRFKGSRVCCIVSGGNADPTLYRALLAGL